MSFMLIYLLYSVLWIVPNAFVNHAFQILEVAPSIYMVEMRKSEGDTLEFHKVSSINKFVCLHI